MSGLQMLWNAILTLCPAGLAAAVLGSDIFRSHTKGGMTAVLLAGLVAFCVVFAVNSSIHSYLILRYSKGDKVRRC